MKVAIIGYGIEGVSAYAYWQSRGADITICDQNQALQIPAGATAQLGPDHLKGLESFDVVCRSAGINPNLITEASPGAGGKITTVTNEFLRVCPTKNIIGITGTKGKGTTSTLIAKILEAAGKQVFLGGNIGRSPLDFLPHLNPESWVVLELSSFQLYDVSYSPHIGVCLMVMPEHLNWHSGLEDYIAAKSNLFRWQKPDDMAIYYASNETSHRIASASPGAKIPYFTGPGAYVKDGAVRIGNQTICNTSELRLLGEHNWQNVCAATTAVWQVVQDVPAIRSVLTTFAGLAHRLEFVREVDGVRYYDDSFGTTPETAIVAIRAFPEPKVIILGGSDKGATFNELAKTVATGNVRHAIVIGDTGPAIAEALQRQGFDRISYGGSTMPEMVAKAKQAARPGDIVLLSTGCASFGLFKDYKDRAAQFRAAVDTL